ncbi:hypothetical protein Dimus_033702, partial [Dionaea muscipula]
MEEGPQLATRDHCSLVATIIKCRCSPEEDIQSPPVTAACRLSWRNHPLPRPLPASLEKKTHCSPSSRLSNGEVHCSQARWLLLPGSTHEASVHSRDANLMHASHPYDILNLPS